MLTKHTFYSYISKDSRIIIQAFYKLVKNWNHWQGSTKSWAHQWIPRNPSVDEVTKKSPYKIVANYLAQRTTNTRPNSTTNFYLLKRSKKKNHSPVTDLMGHQATRKATGPISWTLPGRSYQFVENYFLNNAI